MTALPVLLLALLLCAPTTTDAFSLRMMATTSPNANKVNIVAGATGYIGKSVVRESVRQGYQTVALVRDASKVTSPEGKALYGEFLEGAKLVECDVTNPDQLLKVRKQCSIYLLCVEFSMLSKSRRLRMILIFLILSLLSFLLRVELQ